MFCSAVMFDGMRRAGTVGGRMSRTAPDAEDPPLPLPAFAPRADRLCLAVVLAAAVAVIIWYELGDAGFCGAAPERSRAGLAATLMLVPMGAVSRSEWSLAQTVFGAFSRLSGIGLLFLPCHGSFVIMS